MLRQQPTFGTQSLHLSLGVCVLFGLWRFGRLVRCVWGRIVLCNIVKCFLFPPTGTLTMAYCGNRPLLVHTSYTFPLICVYNRVWFVSAVWSAVCEVEIVLWKLAAKVSLGAAYCQATGLKAILWVTLTRHFALTSNSVCGLPPFSQS